MLLLTKVSICSAKVSIDYCKNCNDNFSDPNKPSLYSSEMYVFLIGLGQCNEWE